MSDTSDTEKNGTRRGRMYCVIGLLADGSPSFAQVISHYTPEGAAAFVANALGGTIKPPFRVWELTREACVTIS